VLLCNWDTLYYRGRDRLVVGFATTYAIRAYHHKHCEFPSIVLFISQILDKLHISLYIPSPIFYHYFSLKSNNI
jgi:hypothetical protein